jgi:selenocysteine lyase/cysteine desulfurase
VRPVGEAGLNAVRVSFHVCNDIAQVRALVEEIRRIARA